MKTRMLFLFLTIFSLVNVANSQKMAEPIDSVYIAGAAKTVSPVYSFNYNGIVNYDGVAGFVFNVVNRVDTLTMLIFEGAYDGSGYVPIDTLTELIDSRTYSFYQAPPVYQKYRIRAPLVSGDTSILKNIIYFEKLPIK